MPLVTSAEMFAKAYDGGYAIGAFNVNNMEIIQGIVEAGRENNAPLILQVSKGARAYANPIYLKKLVEAAVEDSGLPICLHLDHGDSFETCKSCVDGGFTSVMIDASGKPFEENIAITQEVVKYAHDHGVVVEAELGTLAGIEDEVSHAEGSYTRPEDVQEFVERTGCDSLAIAIGTSHGAYKFKPEQCTRDENGILQPPPLRFDILEDVAKRLPGFPIVLHGSSSVPQEFVKIINTYGGAMPDAVGVPEDQLRKAASMAVCKINIDSFCGASGRFRPETVPETCPRGREGHGCPQAGQRSGLQRQGLTVPEKRGRLSCESSLQAAPLRVILSARFFISKEKHLYEVCHERRDTPRGGGDRQRSQECRPRRSHGCHHG